MLFQNQYLSTITRHLHIMVETSLDKLNDSTDLSMFESSYTLKDLNDDLENQTTMLTTLADIFAHSGNSKYMHYILKRKFWKPRLSEEYIYVNSFASIPFPTALNYNSASREAVNDNLH